MGKPKIRFKGCTEDWEQRKLGEVAEKVYGGGTPKTSEEEFWGGNIPWFQSADLHEHEVQLTIPKKAITTLGLQKSAAQLVPGNSIAIVTRVGVGKLVFMPFSYATSQDFLSLSELNIDEKFGCYAIYRLLQREKKLTQGTSIKGITKNEILQKKIAVPNKMEQKKVGDYFTGLDTLITLHQRKCDETKKLKKYMLQKMLPKNGMKVPEIRFEGFTGDWEQRKLGKLVQFSKGAGYSKADLREQGTPIILYGRLYTKYETVITDIDTFADAKAGSVYSCGGEVIIPASGETAEDISIASVVEKAGVLLGGDLNIITASSMLNPAFLAISISNGKPHYDMAKMAQGKSVVHLHNSDLAKIDLAYPCLREQLQISAYFRSIDNLITLHQRKYDELVKIKKFMLQNMFV